jgi:RNA polymerase sigma-70 factor (subfamily 1)
MTEPSDWDWDRYSKLLRMTLRLTQLDPQLDPLLRARLDASEVISETLMRAYQAKDQCRAVSEGERIAWLKQILKNVARDMRGKEYADKRDPAREQSIHVLAAGSAVRLDAMLPNDKQSTPAQRLQREEELLLLAEAMDDLREEEREVILLRYFHGQTAKEAAEQLGKSPKAVAGLYQRGIQRLRKRLAHLREGQASLR